MSIAKGGASGILEAGVPGGTVLTWTEMTGL